jgi:hypothetical protein
MQLRTMDAAAEKDPTARPTRQLEEATCAELAAHRHRRHRNDGGRRQRAPPTGDRSKRELSGRVYGGYNCVHNWGFSWGIDGCWQPDPTTQEEVPIDCGKLALCGIAHVCTCTASACSIPPAEASAPIQLDAALTPDGTQLTGTLIIGGQRITIRMSR